MNIGYWSEVALSLFSLSGHEATGSKQESMFDVDDMRLYLQQNLCSFPQAYCDIHATSTFLGKEWGENWTSKSSKLSCGKKRSRLMNNDLVKSVARLVIARLAKNSCYARMKESPLRPAPDRSGLVSLRENRSKTGGEGD